MKHLVILLSLAGCGAIALPGGSQFPSGPIVEHDSGILSSDKGLHFVMGMTVATTTRVLATEYTDWSRQEVMLAGCAAATTIGLAKELYDLDAMGTEFETLDAVYTAAGCLFTFEWAF